MFTLSMLRMPAAAVAALVAVGTVGALPAQAKPTKPGAVTITTLQAKESAYGTYDVTVDWNTATPAASYEAPISRSGTVLKSATLTGTEWTPGVSGNPGQQLTVQVRGLAGHFKGKWATKSVTLTDQLPPTASYSDDWDNDTGIATLTELGLEDDSPLTGVTRTVDWGDGDTTSYGAGQPITHTYPLTEKRYVPVVTLEDAAHNASHPVEAPAVVINDTKAPTGDFTNATTTAWAKFTKVTVAQNGDLVDNWSPSANITRSVDWGDGTVVDWTTGTTLSHVYADAGTYQPKVTITDEAGNPAVEPTSDVVVRLDATAPKVKLTLPRSKHSVKAWTTLRGTATDGGTGVKSVWVKAVEKRGATWYGYNAVTHKWVKATSKTKAFTKAKAFTRTTNARHRWNAKLAKLRKGTLVYKVRATDRVNNRSVTVTHQATLTKA
jgi:hypothetical protein